MKITFLKKCLDTLFIGAEQSTWLGTKWMFKCSRYVLYHLFNIPFRPSSSRTLNNCGGANVKIRDCVAYIRKLLDSNGDIRKNYLTSLYNDITHFYKYYFIYFLGIHMFLKKFVFLRKSCKVMISLIVERYIFLYKKMVSFPNINLAITQQDHPMLLTRTSLFSW